MSALLGSPRELLGSPLELLGSPQELLATIRQLAPLKWLVNRFNRHSRATSSQLYSANTFVDLSIPQTLEALNSQPVAFGDGLLVGGGAGRAGRLCAKFESGRCSVVTCTLDGCQNLTPITFLLNWK